MPCRRRLLASGTGQATARIGYKCPEFWRFAENKYQAEAAQCPGLWTSPRDGSPAERLPALQEGHLKPVRTAPNFLLIKNNDHLNIS